MPAQDHRRAVPSARALAAGTPFTRDRYVDLLRAVAILTVVVGHWLAVTLQVRAGELTGQNLLVVAPWTELVTWAFQVMPIFFLVGGYANSASWVSAQRRGAGALAWLKLRSRRLLRPTTVFILVGAGGCALLRLAGVDPAVVATAGWLVGISLWFLAVYLAVVALTPVTAGWHARWGLRVPLVLGVLAALADAARLAAGVPAIGTLNFLVVWLLVHQLGYAWRDGTLLRHRAVPAALAGGGLAALVGLVTIGPYPVSMVNVPGAPLHNTSPPSLALLALALTQTGLVLLLRAPLSRLVARPRVWLATVAVNAVVMSLYLWHMVPVVVAAPLLYLTGIFPQPPVAGPAWWALRPVWLAALAVLLAGILRVVARFERPPSPSVADPGPTAPPGRASRLAATAGVALVCAGLVRLTVDGLSAEGPAGLPLLGLVAYGGGLLLVRLAARGARRNPR